MRLPNIVYIHSHDTGRAIQPYGCAVATPNLQALADRGATFRQAFCAGPTCSPSRAALLTGQSPHSCGALGLAHRGFPMVRTERHLVHALRRAGYHSILCGIQHTAPRPDQVGYDECPVSTHDPEAAAIAFLAAPQSKPFFLDVGFFETHRLPRGPHSPPGPAIDARYVRPPAHLPDTAETRADWADFLHSVRRLDRKVGIVLRAIDDARLAESTVVVYTTDHGPAFPGMKCNLNDAGTGVALIVAGPGGFGHGRVFDALVCHMDVYPTLCSLAGIDVPDWVEGRSLLPLVRGEADRVRDAAFSEVTWHAAPEPMRSVRTERWRYVRRYDDRHGPVLPNVDDSPTKDVLLAHGWRDAAPHREALYDLVRDPGEAVNLARDPSVAEPLEEMRARLDRWMAETRDPLLDGMPKPPPGAVANHPDGQSPNDATVDAATLV